ncbi:MAG: hypothetical protein ACLPTF_01295 [Steroidobacteraceae bacterium]
MAVYAVIASNNAPAIKQSIVAQYGANHFEFTSNVWFVSDLTATTKEVADKIGLTKGENNMLGAVLRFEAYSGRHSTAAWTWLAAIPGMLPNG